MRATSTVAATVATLVRGPVASVAPSATLEAAASLLTADELGLLVVLDPTGVRGVLSERDIVTAVADGADLAIERVSDHAVAEVLSVPDTATIAESAALMRDAGIRHLLVTRGDEPIGVVSIRDLLDALLAERST